MDDYDLKPLTREGLAGALERAKQYRLLNEPGVAESICRDILLVDAEHDEARIVLLLALTDMFARSIGDHFAEALALARTLPDPYARAYYSGIVHERRAKAHQRGHAPAGGQMAHDWFLSALQLFAEAERLRPPGDDSAILRWNNCVRRLRAQGEPRPGTDAGHPPLTDD